MKIDVQEVTDFIQAQGPNTHIYLGADSIRYRIYREWWAEYTVAVHRKLLVSVAYFE